MRSTTRPDAPPRRICLLRLSALGDCANVVPIVHTVQAHWPETRIGWIVNTTEAALVGDLPGVDFYVLDKRGGRAGLEALKKQLRGERFDVLLHMHASWRANRASRLVRADRRIGFGTMRTRDLQRWFVDEPIDAPKSRHVVDGFFAFIEKLGLNERVYDWRVPVSAADRAYAAMLLAGDRRSVLFISPCSSHERRNWTPERYAAVADYARHTHGLRCVLVGGPSDTEHAMARDIAAAMSYEPLNLVGWTGLKQLLALFEYGRVLISPDSGPAHMANATEIDIISLHAATDSRRSGAYRCRDLCVDYFAQAAETYRGGTPDTVPWGARIEEKPGVMELIPISAVIDKLDLAMARQVS